MIQARSTLMARFAGAILLAVLVSPAPVLAAPGASEIKDALEDNTGPLVSGGLRLDRSMLSVAYRAHDFEPVWTAPEMTEAFESALGAAGREGLDPESFDFSALKSALSGSGLTPVGRELLPIVTLEAT